VVVGPFEAEKEVKIEKPEKRVKTIQKYKKQYCTA